MFNDDKDLNESANNTKERLDEAVSKVEEMIDTAKNVADSVAEGAADIKEKAEEIIDSAKEDFKEKYMKAIAEMENLRKRFDQERKDVMKFRASSFIQNILPTVDMFEMAMKAQNASEEVRNWLIGFEMILNNFKSTLENEGVKEIVVKKGDDFNHSLHHAIEEVEIEDVEPGKVVEVKMKGYTIHDRLLRPATVTVAKSQDDTKEENKEEEKGE